MVVRVSVGVDDGTPVVRQWADGPDGARLGQIAVVLEAAQGAGVVRLVASHERDGGWELITEHGGRDLAASPPSSLADVVGVGREVAGTLTRLHEQDIVHARLTATHVLRGHDGRWRLRGFAPAGGEAASAPSGASGDVAALVVLLGELLDQLGSPAPHDRSHVDAVRTVLARASTARRLAVDLEALEDPPERRRPRPRRALAAGAAMAVVVVLAVRLRSADGGPGEPARPTASSTTSTSAPGVPRCIATVGQPLRAAACGHEVVVERGVVVVDGDRFVVGLDGDEVAVADWDCAGALRAAVLRPSTGEVRVFAPFVPGAGAVVARAERIDGATSLEATVVDGCPTLGRLRGNG